MTSSASSDSGSQGLREGDLPALYEAANEGAARAQQRFLFLTKVRLFGFVCAAILGTLILKLTPGGADWAGILAAVAFGASLFAELLLYREQPERSWYENRAAAESAKTLAWRYAVGGQPFPVDTAHVDELFLGRLASLFDVLRHSGLSVSSTRPQISERMKALRASPLPARVAAYEAGRVAEQQAWYSQKAEWNRRRGVAWASAGLVIEFIGLVAALLKATGMVERDWLGVASAGAAGIAGWVQGKQYRTLSSAYAVTTLELASLRARVGHHDSDVTWATFVDDSEEAFSREHSLWKASRGPDVRLR